MKKYFIFIFIFLLACGPSEEEIQAQIDMAVKEATETTTTLPTTTTTLSKYEKCRSDVQTLLKLFQGEYRRIPVAYNQYVTAVRSTFVTRGEFDFDDIEAERARIDLTNSLEVVLIAKSNLVEPENRTTYQEYYFTFEKLMNTWVDIYENWLKIQSGYSAYEQLVIINEDLEKIDELRAEIYDITYCQK